MKKVISLLILVLILTGCVAVDSNSVYNSLQNTINLEEHKVYKNRTNNITNYIDYYMPSDLSEKDYDNTTFTFKYHDSIIVYNINIADIINNKYYIDQLLSGNNFFNEDYLFLEHQGTMESINGQREYNLDVYQIEDTYLIAFYDIDSYIYGYATAGDVREVLRKIYIIAKTVEIDYDKIIADYSDKDVISSTRKTIDLFSYVYPSTGYLADLITTDTSNSSSSTSN